ncbi:MAG: glycosyltransferase family 39 protein [Endomicrobiaceae bacterium]
MIFRKLIKTKLFFFILLSSAVFFIYAKSLSFGFTDLDDDTLVVKNIHYISNISNIHKHFLTDCYYIHDFQYYRPVLSVSFSIESMLFGGNPKIYHINNMIFFILSVFLMYCLLDKLNFNKTIVKIICMLVAVHPVFTSCAVWIPARNDTLLLIFLILSLINFINYLEKNDIKYLILYGFFFITALFTKETTVILIPLYVFFAYCFNFKISKEKIFKIFLMMVPILIIYFILRSIAVPSVNIEEYFFNWQKYSSNIIKGIMLYVDKFLEPGYIQVMLYSIKLNLKIILINAAVYSILVFLYCKNIINRKIMLFGIIWFIVCLLPTFFTPEYLFLTHRVIISSLGMIMIVALIADRFICMYPSIKKYLSVLSVILFLVFSYFSYFESDKYENPDVFWTNAYMDEKEYHVVYFTLAQRYLVYKDYKKAKQMIEKAVDLSPNVTNFIELTRISFLINKNIEEAEANYLNILDKTNGENFQCFFALSEIYYLKKDIPKAVEYAKKAANLRENDIVSLENLAQLYAINREYRKAIDISFKLLKLNKEKKEYYYYNISLLYRDLENNQQSLLYIKKALQINPGNYEYKKILEELVKQKE